MIPENPQDYALSQMTYRAWLSAKDMGVKMNTLYALERKGIIKHRVGPRGPYKPTEFIEWTLTGNKMVPIIADPVEKDKNAPPLWNPGLLGWLKKHGLEAGVSGGCRGKEVGDMAKNRGPSKEQKGLMQRFYDHTCFEFMGIDRVSADDPKGFMEEWDYNIQWLKDVVEETDRFMNDYQEKHFEEEASHE